MSERPNDDHDERPSDPEFGRWLNAALGEPPRPTRSLLPSVEQRIFVQSKGRHFRRSRALTNPSLLVLGLGCVLLVLAAAAYLTLGRLWAPESGRTPREESKSPDASSRP